MPRLKGSQIPPSTGRSRATGPRCIQCGERLAEQLAATGVEEHILCTTLPPEVYDAKAFGSRPQLRLIKGGRA